MDVGYGEYGRVQPTAKDANIRNQRPMMHTNGPSYLPSTEMMGEFQEKVLPRLDVNIERTSPELLNAYRSNPYTQFRNNDQRQLPSMI
jgi:hypothetical protein